MEELTSAIRFAVAYASRGGTMLRMMSDFCRNSSSLPRLVILADSILDIVAGLIVIINMGFCSR